MAADDPWGTESGLLTNYEGTVIDAFFGKDPGYNEKTRMLFLKMATDSPEKPEHEERYNLPDGWETWDGGKTIENRDRGDSAKIHANSGFGKLINAIRVACPEGLDVLRERGSQREAEVWIGTQWFFEETSTPYKFQARVDDPARKQKKGDWIEGTTTKNYPTKFLGTTEVTGPGDDGTAGATTQTAPGEVPSGSSNLPDADRTILKLYAKQKATHPEWVESVMEHEGGRFLSNPELVATLSDDTDSGLWATLRTE